MNRGRALRHTVTAAAALCLLATVVPAASGQQVTAPNGTAAAADRPPLALRAAAKSIEVHKDGDKVYVDLGAFLVAGDLPFEVHANRASYRKPIVGTLMGDPEVPGDETTLSPEMVSSWKGLLGFMHLRVRDSDGHLVVDQTRNLCSTGLGVRTRPDAPDVSPYPGGDFFGGCRYHPFTLGSVLGIQAGWGIPALGYGTRMELDRGRYVATLTIDKDYRHLIGIPADSGQVEIRMRVVKGGEDCRDGRGCRVDDQATGAAPQPRRAPPSCASQVPPGDNFPDLRALPSTGIRVRGNYLTFGATVWNGGPSPLVVDGFRKQHQDVMTSWQYFYEPDGDPAGCRKVGSMEWDPRNHHHHWHFRDFAKYELLDADQETVVRSKKEAFCLAATDAVDYTVEGADWNPYYTDLETQCGGYSSLAVREVLSSGSGDTYQQYRPGQSFRLTDLDPGIYFIATTANPDGNLVETDETNNTGLRKIRLYKSDGEWQVKVFDVGMVSTH